MRKYHHQINNHNGLKAKTTIEKFRKVRVNFKKTQSTADEVIYELIGEPQEWDRKLKRTLKTREELTEDDEYQKNLRERKERQMLRKRVTWEAIYIASIPISLKRVCVRCACEGAFEHVKLHMS